jgi:hypothetical protein
LNRALWWRQGAKLALTTIVLALVGRYIWLHAAALSDVRFRAPAWLVAATGVAMVAPLMSARVCQVLMATHGFHVSFSQAIGLVYLPMLGKYVPGKVWSLLAALQLCGSQGIPAKVSSTYLTLFMALGLGSAAIVSIAFGLTSLGPELAWAAIGVVASLAIVLYPPVFYGALNAGLRRLHRGSVDVQASVSSLLQAVGLLVVGKVAYGTAFFLVILSVAEVPWGNLPGVVALFTFAQIAGLVALFAPAGIGVREGVLLMGLQPLVGPGPAIVITGVARLWQTALELLLAAIGWWMLKRKNVQMPTDESDFQAAEADPLDNTVNCVAASSFSE